MEGSTNRSMSNQVGLDKKEESVSKNNQSINCRRKCTKE
jgi:hypothetical protein